MGIVDSRCGYSILHCALCRSKIYSHQSTIENIHSSALMSLRSLPPGLTVLLSLRNAGVIEGHGHMIIIHLI